MGKEIKELTKMSDDELVKHKKELRISVLQASPNMVKQIIPDTNRGKIRRRIARINTILGERKLRGVAKEEIRLK